MESKESVNTFDELVANLRTVFDSNTVDVDYVKKLLSSYQSNPNEWKKFAHFDQHKYTRNLVDTGNGKYNLILVCWSEGPVITSIHDHSDAHCFMKILSGNIHEIRYKWPDTTVQHKSTEDYDNSSKTTQEMKVLEENELKNNDVAYINDSLGLHRMENRSHTYPAVSLHLYSPPYSKSQIFDPKTGQRNQSEAIFFSKYGSLTPHESIKFVNNS